MGIDKPKDVELQPLLSVNAESRIASHRNCSRWAKLACYAVLVPVFVYQAARLGTSYGVLHHECSAAWGVGEQTWAYNAFMNKPSQKPLSKAELEDLFLCVV